jgi:hypothetical protein
VPGNVIHSRFYDNVFSTFCNSFHFHLLVACIATYKYSLLIGFWVSFPCFTCTFQDYLLLRLSLLYWQTWQVILKVEGISFSTFLQKSKKKV